MILVLQCLMTPMFDLSPEIIITPVTALSPYFYFSGSLFSLELFMMFLLMTLMT